MSTRATNRPWWTLAAMCFGLFMIMLDNTIVNVALPSIQRSLHTTPETLQWTIDAYVLTFAVLILLGGKLGDRFGRKRMFLAGLLVFTLSSAACAQATTDTQLAFRAIQGAGAALLNPPAELAGLDSFVTGLRGALLTSSLLTLAAAAVTFAGLRPSRPNAQELEVPEAVPTARAA